ncbi:MAG: hypothetical protein O3A25_20060 [Acidobacteria bacterium]|nr:hypothetical protein [Acidobacteriota bacterium]
MSSITLRADFAARVDRRNDVDASSFADPEADAWLGRELARLRGEHGAACAESVDLLKYLGVRRVL